MDSLIYVLFISIFLPLFLMMLLVEKRARLPIAFVLIGISISVFASEVNGFLLRAFSMRTYDATITLAPVTEELLKALPILFYAIVISDKRETLFTAAMATGIGFAVLENAHYLVENLEAFSFFSALVRGFGTGLMHGMCTLFIGFGISFVRKRKKLFAVSTFALLTAAITYHAIFNMLIQSEFFLVGVFMPIVTYTPFFLWRYIKAAKKRRLSPAK